MPGQLHLAHGGHHRGAAQWAAATACNNPARVLCSAVRRQLRVAEFFSGIGGMHYALQRVLPQDWELHVQACDINATANDTYAHNFGGCRPRTYDLNQITAKMLDGLGAELWCLSPPCQPYTRTLNAQRRDACDPRAKSLLRILQELPRMSSPPALLILENVEGFAGGQVHELFKSTLAACAYYLQEFMVSPHQLRIPYLRSRYFALASLQPLRCSSYDGRIVRHPPTLMQHEAQIALGSPLLPTSLVHTLLHKSRDSTDGPVDRGLGSPCSRGGHAHRSSTCMSSGQLTHNQLDPVLAPESTALTLEKSASIGTEPSWRQPAAAPDTTEPEQLNRWPPCSFAGEHDIRPITQLCLPLGRFLEHGGRYDPTNQDILKLWEEYAVPEPVLSKFWRSYDVVTSASTHSNCVTKNYSRTGVAAGSMVGSPTFVDTLCRLDSRGRVHMQEDPTARCFGNKEGAAGSSRSGAPKSEEAGGSSVNGGRGPSCASSRAQAGDGVTVQTATECVMSDGVCASAEMPGRPDLGLADASLLQQLRYLTPREVANLHGFPAAQQHPGARGNGFALPPDVNIRQAYALLGNSLSIDVVAWLLLYLLSQELSAAAAPEAAAAKTVA